MATSATTLLQRTRRYLQDWPQLDSSTASITSGGTALAVADSTLYTVNWAIQLDNEAMLVRAKPSSTSLTVYRAARGSTGASHASGAEILVNPRFTDMEYLDALNAGISATFPMIYQPVVDESTTTSDSIYEYTIPNLNSVPIPYISKLQYKETGDLTFRDFQSWRVLRGSTPKLKLRRPLPGGGTLRIYGFGPIPMLTGFSDSLSTLFPSYAEDALTMFAAQYLLGAGEAARVRQDTGARDNRENANRVGSSISAGNQIYSRFLQRIRDAALPPMPKHTVSTL